MEGVGSGRCSSCLIDRCRQELWQQVDCSYFSCRVEEGGGGGENNLSCDESVGPSQFKGTDT